MSTRTGVDTGALLALADPRDQYHSAASRIVRRLISDGVVMVGTTLVLAELHVLLLRHRGPERARTVISRVLDDPSYEWVEVSPTLVREAVADWLERFHDQRFSLTTAVTFEVLRRERIHAAFAFDEDFVTAGFELLR
ncbi:MAG: type II toxin-antitoxin system VapC family toxin [Gemmatimonadales bacterium]